MPNSPLAPSETALVVCLCAQWCNVCEQYRSSFTQVQASLLAEFPDCQFAWLDVEDNADVLDPLDVENFPTLLLLVGATPRFFGPITPQPQTLERLVRMALDDPDGRGLADPAVKELALRVRTWQIALAQLPP
jgi:thioredoxin-like negative regulator of GroEL